MKEAINKAIEGGWFPIKKGALQEYYLFQDGGRYGFEADGKIELMSVGDVTSQPLFWQALFKQYIPGRSFKMNERHLPQWRTEWHKFIDHLAEGKDAESFFTSLISNNE